MSKRFFGKYRGVVFNNADPLGMGRLQVRVPAVSGATATSWALSCVPCLSDRRKLLALPEAGQELWIEFEEGDADRPVWIGCMWPAESA